jgi:hypothetical protein
MIRERINPVSMATGKRTLFRRGEGQTHEHIWKLRPGRMQN